MADVVLLRGFDPFEFSGQWEGGVVLDREFDSFEFSGQWGGVV
jgi:hypothetical protein